MAQIDNTKDQDPILYSKGDDNSVELRSYIDALRSGYDSFAQGLIGRYYTNSAGKKVKITEKDLPKLRQAHRDMLSRINSGDNSFTARLEGGFTDNTGRIKNNEDFDSYGIIASYYGKTLRGMSPYKKPEPTPDPSKIKYSNTALGEALKRRLLGTSGSIQDFVDLDSPDETTGIRGNIERSKRFREALQGIHDDWKGGVGEFSDYTDDQRTQGLKDIESLFSIFDGDKQVTDNEYLDLARITGLSDLRKWFVTGKQPSQPRPGQTPEQAQREELHRNFLQYLQQNYAPYTGQLAAPISVRSSLGDISFLHEDAGIKIDNWTRSASTNDLLNVLNSLVKDGRLDKNTIFKNAFNNMSLWSPQYDSQGNSLLTTLILQTLKDRSGFQSNNFGETDVSKYYLPGLETGHNTGYVWDTNSNTISEMSYHDIPYWRKKMYQEWYNKYMQTQTPDINPALVQAYPTLSFKQGGTIQKFVIGGEVIGNVEHREGFNWYTYFKGVIDKLAEEGRQKSTPEEKQAFIDAINGMQDRHYNLWSKKSDKGAYRGENDDVKKYQQDIISNYNYVNDIGVKGVLDENFYIYPKGASTSDNLKSEWEPDNYFGGQTDDRRLLGRLKDYTPEELKQVKDLFKQAGYDFYEDDNSHYYKLKLLSADPFEPIVIDYKPATLDPNYKEEDIKPEDIKGEYIPEPALNFGQGRIPESDSQVTEVDTTRKTPSNLGNTLLSKLASFAPELPGLARLPLSIHANNKIAETIRPTLKPVLQNTWERYSPVTGDFGARQFYNNQAETTRRRAYTPVTSDASLEAARQMQADVLAQGIQEKGFLADNARIRQTMSEALARQEDNMARRSQTANANSMAINKADREKAQLEATRLKSNWKSWDNYLAGFEGNIRKRAEEDRVYKNAYEQQQDELANAAKYQTEQDQIKTLISQYTTNNPSSLISSAPWYMQVTNRQAELARRLANDNIVSIGKRRGYNYADQYADNPYKIIDWSNIIV